VGVAWIQARGGAGRAVDVSDGTAAATHHMVVIVIDAHLEARRAPSGFDPSYQTGAGQRTQHVVNGLR
jgi:hypothetical protein